MASPDDLKTRLNAEQHRITQEKGTERAFTGAYWDCHVDGVYRCVVCNSELFDSASKFDSGTGWPSFWTAFSADSVGESRDTSHSMQRTEVHCRQCGAHLGHVFPDGPAPSGLRYCINSASLTLEQRKASAETG